MSYGFRVNLGAAKTAIAALLIILIFSAARAQPIPQPGCVNATPCVQTNVFTPIGSATLSAGSTTSSVALPSPAANLTLLVTNGGAVAVNVALGGSGVTASVGTGTLIPGGQSVALPVGTATYLAGITASGSATLTIQIGSGVPVIIYSSNPSGGVATIVNQGTIPWVISISPTVGSMHQITVTCGTSSTTLLAALSAAIYVKIKVPQSVANTVWVNWAGAAAVAAPPSEDVPSGAAVVWSTVNGYVPQQQFNCLSAPGSQAVTLEYE